ncbi:MAG: thioesterase family protein [Gammaproteobacteria bacterium]|nr:thioesterase family protein [Gammaproteobacteria bacterium]
MITEAPCLHRTTVKAEWLDNYGHMNMAYYLLVCDEATYAFWEKANDGVPIEERGGAEYAVVETHVNYLQEVQLGDPLCVTTQLLGADEKRFRLHHTMSHETQGFVAATNEVMALGFDLNARKLMKFKESVQAQLRQVLVEHAALPLPKNAGRGISMDKRSQG